MSDIKPIVMPRWGLEMTEGTLSAWHVAAGDPIEQGQVIMDVESEKIANEVESEDAGTLRRIVVDAGDTVEIGSLLGVIAPPEVSDADIDAFIAGFKPVAGQHADGTDEGSAATSPDAEPAPPKAATTPSAPRSTADGAPHASPTAKRLARKLGVDLAQVRGTGRNGRISTDDVQRAAADSSGTAPGDNSTPAPQATDHSGGPASSGEYEVIKQTTMRKAIARRLVESKQTVPHFYLTMDVEMDALLELRGQLKRDGRVVSVNDCLVKACALALIDVPDANVQYHGDVVHRFSKADVAVAVATDGGLITPVVRAAESLDIQSLSSTLRDLAGRGRAGKLGAEEFQGGTLTLSNLGMYGIDAFSAVINPPQSAILAVGRAVPRVVVREDDRQAIARVMTATLSCDHRVIDGTLGARWLGAFRERVEQPGEWLQ